MIKLKTLLRETMYGLGGLKVTIKLVDMYYNLEQDAEGNIYAYPRNQTRLVKALEKFGDVDVIESLVNTVNGKYANNGVYRHDGRPLDPTQPIKLQYQPND